MISTSLGLTPEQKDELIEYYIFESRHYNLVEDEIKYVPPFYVENMEERLQFSTAGLLTKRDDNGVLRVRLLVNWVLNIPKNDRKAFNKEGEQTYPFLPSEFTNWWNRKSVYEEPYDLQGDKLKCYYFKREYYSDDKELYGWDIYLVEGPNGMFRVVEDMDFDMLKYINQHEKRLHNNDGKHYYEPLDFNI
jgi:hypothetical protein